MLNAGPYWLRLLCLTFWLFPAPVRLPVTVEWEERPRALDLELVTELLNISYGPFSLVVHLGIFTADSLGLLLCLLQARGLAGLFEKLTEIIGLNRLQGSDQRWALT